MSVVEQPCKLGCRGLDYCANFNDRPTEMFRSCSVEADAGARRDVMLWQNGIISLPALQELPVKGTPVILWLCLWQGIKNVVKYVLLQCDISSDSYQVTLKCMKLFWHCGININ